MATKTKKPSNKSINYEEFGTAGTSYAVDGYLQSEYQANLKGNKMFEVYEKMEKSSSRCEAARLSTSLPIQAGSWPFESPDPEDQFYNDMTEKIRKNFEEGMSESLTAFIRQATKYLQFGNYPFEIIWKNPQEEPPEKDELQTQIKKLAPRHPKTIRRWIMDDNGGLKEVEQYTYFSKGKSSVCKSVLIPIEKLCIFVNEKDGNNWQGKSIYRSAYRYWFANDKLYNFSLIGAERNAVGVPTVTIDWNIWKEISTEEKPVYLATAKDILEKYRIHEYAGFVLLPGMKLEFIDGKFDFTKSIQPMIKDNDRAIAECVLAQFLSTGADSVGSNARFSSEAELFLLSLKSMAKNMAETINVHVIQKLVDYAYYGQNINKYPKISCKLPDFDVEKYFNTITSCVNSKVITPTRVIENNLRNILSLPDLGEDEEGIYEKETSTSFSGFSETKKHDCSEPQAPTWRRDLNNREKKVDFADINKNMDTAEKKLLEAVADITKTQTKFVKKEVESGKDIIDIDLPKMKELQDLFESEALRLAKYGQKQTENELNSKTLSNKQLEEYAKKKGVLQAEKHKADLLIYISSKIPVEGVK